MGFRKLYQGIGRSGLKHIYTTKEGLSKAGLAFNSKFPRTMSVDAMKKRVELLQNVVNSHQKEIQQLNQKVAQTPRVDDTSQSKFKWTKVLDIGALKHTVTAKGRWPKAWFPFKFNSSREMSFSFGESRGTDVDRQFELLHDLVNNHQKEIQELKQKLEQKSMVDDAQSKPKLTTDTGDRMNHQLPSQEIVGFKAILSHRWKTQDADQSIAFDDIHVNIGDAYHPERGVFIAPISGIYAFHTIVFVKPVEPVEPQHTAMCRLTVNGIESVGIYAPITGKRNGWSKMIVEQLKKGDAVDVCMNDTSVIYSDADSYSTFEGFLLGPLIEKLF